MDYCVRENTGTVRDERPIPEPAGVPSIARFVGDTGKNLKEANAILDKMWDNLFGPRPEKSVANAPHVGSLEQEVMLNAEVSAMLLNRIAEMHSRLFG